MEVRKIMTKNPACCTPDSTLREVAHMMEMYDCGCIPVVDDHKAMKPVGTITDRDIAIRAVAIEKNPLEMTAADIMTRGIVTVTPETSVQECLNVMEKSQIRRVLVVDKSGRVTGIVAQADLAEHATSAAQTGHFVREVSETNSEHAATAGQSDSNSFASRRTNSSNTPERRNTQENFLQNRADYGDARKKKSSFFNSTTLLTLLGSIGLGAGVKYFIDSSSGGSRRKFTGTAIKTHPVDAPDIDKTTTETMKTDETSAGFTTGGAKRATATSDNSSKVTGGVGSIDTTDDKYTASGNRSGLENDLTNNDDDDLKPILEIGRTQTNG